jgi:hypothetical protein
MTITNTNTLSSVTNNRCTVYCFCLMIAENWNGLKSLE